MLINILFPRGISKIVRSQEMAHTLGLTEGNNISIYDSEIFVVLSLVSFV